MFRVPALFSVVKASDAPKVMTPVLLFVTVVMTFEPLSVAVPELVTKGRVSAPPRFSAAYWATVMPDVLARRPSPTVASVPALTRVAPA